MEKQTFRLCDSNRQQAAQAFVDAPDGWHLTLAPPTRSLDQNALLHKLFDLVAKQKNFMGRVLTPTQWKVLFVSGHATATGHGADMVPGLEGEFVNIRESTAQMGVKRMASLLEYVTAWCTENDVRIPAGHGYDSLNIRG
ncbi:TPA: recombination protein NinB [Burkholderia multivorans]|nr:recombination protein NinB [Burkholderia multivorans]